MRQQIYWQDIEVGQELPDLIKSPTTTQLVKWAGASGDLYPLHFDKDFAVASGLSGVVVHGGLILSFLTQMISEWIGEDGDIKKMTISFRGMAYCADDLICKAKVTKKYEQDGQHYVELDVWSENPEGKNLTPGTFLVVLPVKK